MKLPKGITGLRTINDGLNIGTFSVSLLKDSLYPAEYTGRFRIGDFKNEIAIYRSFHRLPVLDKRNNELFDILMHTSYPYYCGVQSDTLVFIDLPEEITSVANPDFTYLSAAELNAKYTKDDLTELAEIELKEIRYWRPENVGEIVFNYFD
jgi:hypothetical protein